MPRLIALGVVLNIALLVIALIDCLSVEDESDIRALPRFVWVLLILLFSPIGAIAWFVAGRPKPTTAVGRASVWKPGGGFPESQRPRSVAPDDDPEFLAGLAGRSRREDEELLRRWEEDLKRREDDLRGKDGDEPDTTK